VAANQAAFDLMNQAGAHPTSWVQLISEMQRDTARTSTLNGFEQILFDPQLPFVKAESSVTQSGW